MTRQTLKASSLRKLGLAINDTFKEKEEVTSNIMTDANIQAAGYLWVTNNTAAIAKYGDISSWDTSMVANMTSVFGYFNPNAPKGGSYWAINFNADLSRWNTSLVTTMYDMFDCAWSFNSDLSQWDTARVENFEFMFWEAKMFNGDISSWDTSRATSLAYMFEFSHAFNGQLSTWNIPSSDVHGSYVFLRNRFQSDAELGNSCKYRYALNVQRKPWGIRRESQSS